MKGKTLNWRTATVHWRQFSGKRYAVFQSLGRVVCICVLSASTLAHATPATAQAKTILPAARTGMEDGKLRLQLADVSVLEEGDLLFNVQLPDGGLGQAITEVTEGFAQQRISHVAIVCKRPDGVFALEATTGHGVWLNPIDSFIHSASRSADGKPLILVGRLKDRSNIHASVEKALTYVGWPYDKLYLPCDNEIYCSELVQLSYIDAQGQSVFPQKPMSFHDRTGKVTAFWQDYYNKVGMDVPEGWPGTNPGDLSQSDKLEILYQLVDERSYELGDVEVIGTRAPLSPQHSVRMVQVLTRREILATSAQSVNDLLKLVAGVDVRQRGAYGIQTDIGVNGGTSDQLTVLLNGVNISNVQTGHHTMNLPVAVDDIERIEVLEGGASRVYGSSAFSGAINIVTRQSNESNFGLNLSGGSFGTAAAGAHLNLANATVFNRFAGNYSRSDGGSVNSDFNKGGFFWNGGYNSQALDVRWQAGASAMNYGANTFYSAAYNNQYEENRRYMLALSAEMKGRVRFTPSVYWSRALDHYLLFRDNPSAYENFHQLNIYGANLNASVDWALGKIAFGAEMRHESILSNSLGRPLEESELVKVPGHDAYYKNSDNRTNVSYFLEHNFLWDRVTVSLGLLANMNSALDYRFRLYPGVDMSWRFASGWKLYASFNQALRMPTFTDLYYKSPNINGNVGLKPEKSSDYTFGVQYSSPAFQTKAKVFYRRGTDMIDWVKYYAEDSYHSANFDLNNYGAEWSAVIDFAEMQGKRSFLQRLNLSYAYIYQTRRDDMEIYRSSYALDFLKNKLVVSLNHRLFDRLSAQWDFRLQHRNGAFELYRDGKITGELTPYGTTALLDLKLQWESRNCTVYLQGNNLTNHRYYDLGNVRQPGFWLMGGIKKVFAL